MSELTSRQYIDALENGWGTYVGRIKRLSAQEESDFLNEQGYACLGDLLGHIIAWWEVGMPAVQNLLRDPELSPEEYDVDAFNARAVERFSKIDEARVIQTFEATRNAWIKLVENLPEQAFSNKKLVARLDIELIGHLDEHKLIGK
jgi:hypothetical protein